MHREVLEMCLSLSPNSPQERVEIALELLAMQIVTNTKPGEINNLLEGALNNLTELVTELDKRLRTVNSDPRLEALRQLVMRLERDFKE